MCIRDRFKQFKPLRCDGKVSQDTKTENRRLFQQHNNNYRLMIAKPTSFGDAISLNDTSPNGEFPRYTYINPHFFFNFIVQASGRTYRVGTTSDVNVTLTYCQATDEKNVIAALSKKGDVTRACIAKLVDDADDAENEDEEYVLNDNTKFIDEWPHVMEN